MPFFLTSCSPVFGGRTPDNSESLLCDKAPELTPGAYEGICSL